MVEVTLLSNPWRTAIGFAVLIMLSIDLITVYVAFRNRRPGRRWKMVTAGVVLGAVVGVMAFRLDWMTSVVVDSSTVTLVYLRGPAETISLQDINEVQEVWKRETVLQLVRQDGHIYEIIAGKRSRDLITPAIVQGANLKLVGDRRWSR